MGAIDTTDLGGLRKAAVLLVQMGKEGAARVLAAMRDAEVEALSAEIVRLGPITADVGDAVLDEFHAMAKTRRHMTQGGMDYARDLLVSTVGVDRADEIVSRIGAAMADVPFSFLQRADPRQVLSYLQDEHPQTIALVLAHMAPNLASMVLSGLPADHQADVALRVATMGSVAPDTVRRVEDQLERKLSSLLLPSDVSTLGGVKPLVDIINRADRATERSILDGLAKRSPELAEEIRGQMFLFEDIVGIEDRSMQLLLRQVESQDLATALKGVRDEVRDKVLRNLSERAAENLAEEIELLGSVRMRAVEEAQAKVIAVIRTFEESGQIILRRGGDDEEFVN
jgi:flagellar motor switch protein FliG